MKIITLLTAILVAVILGGAAVDKLLHWEMFVNLVRENPLLPARSAAALGGGIVAAEIAVAAGVLCGPSRRCGLFAAGLLFALFSAVTGILALVAPGTPCGCWFALKYAQADLPHFLQNLLCVALCWYVWSTGSFRLKPAPEM